MPQGEDDAVRLIAGLLSHVREVVGDGASYAMFHYGAVEEGKRLGLGVEGGDLAGVLRHLDVVLGQSSEIVRDEGGVVTVRVTSPRLLGAGGRTMEGIMLGLLEGALTSARHHRYRGTVASHGPGEPVVVELRRGV